MVGQIESGNLSFTGSLDFTGVDGGLDFDFAGPDHPLVFGGEFFKAMPSNVYSALRDELKGDLSSKAWMYAFKGRCHASSLLPSRRSLPSICNEVTLILTS